MVAALQGAVRCNAALRQRCKPASSKVAAKWAMLCIAAKINLQADSTLKHQEVC